MSHTVIKVENLSKYYRLGLIGGGTLREDVNRWMAKIQGKPDPILKIGETDHGNRKGDQIWALRDVNFEVQEGEILGVIGRNGAGKSTLLKVLARITAPTEGRITFKGRIGSLLEVGTGFHPELTGRENIYLNGTILGMKKAEVASKLEEIIEFAEMAKFIDTPVKRYSSGMTVRLAFAVAAHLEPEILIIDEVLAVGDFSFQKKCIGKMSQVAKEGRTVLFVSHNMASVRSICHRALLLRHGTLASSGDVDEIIDEYLNDSSQPLSAWSIADSELEHRREIFLISAGVSSSLDGKNDAILSGGRIQFRLAYKVADGYRIREIGFVISIKDRYDTEICRLSNAPISGFPIQDVRHSGEVELLIEKLPLSEGYYKVDITLTRPGQEILQKFVDILQFNVTDSNIYQSGAQMNQERGVLLLPHRWRHRNFSGIAVESNIIGEKLLMRHE